MPSREVLERLGTELGISARQRAQLARALVEAQPLARSLTNTEELERRLRDLSALVERLEDLLARARGVARINRAQRSSRR